MKFLEKFFSKGNCSDGEHKKYTFLGISVKKRDLNLVQRKYQQQLLNLLEWYRVKGFSPVSTIHEQIENVVHTALLHQKSFGDLRCINAGKEVVICATGPTLDYYEPIKNAVHIGVKDAYKIEKIEFDYLFHHDVTGYDPKIITKEFTGYRGKDCIKFIGNSVPFLCDGTIEDNSIRFFNSADGIHYQIDYFPLPDFFSIVFPAFTFALWTKPERIYLVGADCSKGYSKNARVNRDSDASILINFWGIMKDFAQAYYPDIEIISINPVGLKGLFKNVYTEKYLKKAGEQ